MAATKSGILKSLIRFGRLSFAVGLLAATGALFFVQYRFQMPWQAAYTKFVDSQLWWYQPRYPSAWPFWSLVHALRVDEPANPFEQILTGSPTLEELTGWGQVGPQLATKPENEKRRVRFVMDQAGLTEAIAAAQPGDVIELLPGLYEVKKRRLAASAMGTASAPITVRARRLGDAELVFGRISNGYVEGFQVKGAHWTFENLLIRGACAKHSSCEHAFHIVGAAKGFRSLNNIILDFNAHFKINRSGGGESSPDGGLIENNFLGNSEPRKTSNPATPIDLVGADYWTVRRSVIADAAKNGGDFTSYAGFYKGSGRASIFRENLVLCSWRHRGGTRIGFSIGGGGTGESYRCANRARCDQEYSDATIEGNIIANCSDVGIYINRGENSIVKNNALIRTAGIDVRFRQSSAIIQNNIVDGRIIERDGGTLKASGNLVSWWRAGLLKPVSPTVYALNARGQLTISADTPTLLTSVDSSYRDETWCLPSAGGGFRGPALPASGGSKCVIALKPGS